MTGRWRIGLLMAALTLWVGAVAAPALAAAEYPSIAAYAGWLEQVEAGVRAAAGPPAEAAELQQLARSLPAEVWIKTPAGPTRVDLRLLRQQMEAAGQHPEAMAALQQELKQMVAAARAAAASPGSGDLAADRQRLERLEARRAATLQRLAWSNRLGRWLEDWLSRIGSDGEFRLPPVLRWLLVGAGLLTLGWAAVYLARQWRWLRSGDTLDPARRAQVRTATAPRPEQLWQEARGLAHTGDYRAALRALYLGLLLHLDRQGLIRYRPSATNGSYLRDLARQRGDLQPHLAALTRLFESRWYGHKPALASDWTAAAGLARQIWQGAGGPAPAYLGVQPDEPAG